MVLLGDDTARHGGDLHVNRGEGAVSNGAAESTSDGKAGVEVNALWGLLLDLLGHGSVSYSYSAAAINRSWFEKEQARWLG